MKYRFYGEKLQLVKYELSVTHDNEYTDTLLAATDTEKAELLTKYPDAVVAEVDNTGYEWLDGREIPKDEVDLAIELGQEEYEKYIAESDPTYQMLDLDMRVALLEMGVTLNELSAD